MVPAPCPICCISSWCTRGDLLRSIPSTKNIENYILQTAMIPTVGLKLVGVNIYENIKGQPYFNSRNLLWVLFVLLVTP